MERLTKKCADGTYEAAEGRSTEELIQKLAKYETMQEELCMELDAYSSDMEKLRSEGKLSTVTFKQKFANKLLVMEFIGRFHRYGI